MSGRPCCVVLKPIFDCRGDSDALYHQYDVKLRNMYDVQVVFCLKRDEEAGGGACQIFLATRAWHLTQ